LEGLAKKVKNENKNKADKRIQLYKDRKISQATTAEKQILNFIEYNTAKDSRKKTINEKYDKIITKYQDSKPLNEKISDKKKANNEAKGVAIKKVQNYIRDRITFETKIIDKAFKEKLISVEVKTKGLVGIL
jgi:hypothetical protein